MGAGADFLVLTKNQAMMMIKLAAVYGHSLDSRWRLAAELAPVVGPPSPGARCRACSSAPCRASWLPAEGHGCLWRHLRSRQAARYYFEHGQRPSPELERQFAREAVTQWQGTWPPTGVSASA